MKDYKWPHVFRLWVIDLTETQGYRLWRKTRWMGILVPVPLARSSRRTGLNSRCCLGCHILAVIPLQCRICLCACNRHERPWMETTWDGRKNGLRLFSITCCSGDSDQSSCAAGSFLKDVIFTVYRHLDLFSLKWARLHPASMFIYIIYSIILFECSGPVFISNEPWSVWFPLRAHALIKLGFSCL